MVLSQTHHLPAPTSEVQLQIIKNADDDNIHRESSVFHLPSECERIIVVGWASMMLTLGLVTFGFPCIDSQEQDFNKALITYMTMLILELGMWIPMCTYISPPEGRLKKIKIVLRASFGIFNHVSNISEQIASSISHLNYGKAFIFINLFCGVVSFFIISALCWLDIDAETRAGLKWEHLPLGCNAVLSATILNISVFQLIIKRSFLHFPLFAILRDVIDLIDFIMRMVHKKEMAWKIEG